MWRSTSRSRVVSWSSSVEGVEHEPGQARREHGVVGLDPADGGGQVGRGDRLGHIPAGPGPDHPDDVLGRVRHRQGQEADLLVGLADRLQDRLAAPAGQVHVEQDHVRAGPADAVDGRVHLAGLADDLELGPQLGPEPRQEEVVVVDEKDPDHPWLLGRRSWTSVPSPGLETMVTDPP
jgi:hypothetical protein